MTLDQLFSMTPGTRVRDRADGRDGRLATHRGLHVIVEWDGGGDPWVLAATDGHLAEFASYLEPAVIGGAG